MTLARSMSFVASLASLLAAAGCGSSSSPSGCNPSDPNACSAGNVCEPVPGGTPACFAPLVVKGQVTDLQTSAAVPNARVVALDANRAPASAVAVTDASGNYTLAVPAARNANGTPAAASLTLRADAQNYQTFPGGIRTALPVDLSTATNPSGSQWVVQGALTAVKLLHLASTTNLASVSGTAAVPATRVGVLVVAAPAPGGRGFTAIADVDGSYTIFNVPSAASPGTDYAVNAYAQGTNYNPGAVTLTTGTTPPTVNLTVKNTTTASVGGTLQPVSSATGATSATLVVQSTYDGVLDRGESPPGLVVQLADVSTPFDITGVPDGTYVLLAAFGIDGLVRDVAGQGGTAPVVVTVQGGAVVGTVAQFKIVSAVVLDTIDGVAVGTTGVPIQIASASPVFAWSKAPSYSQAATFRTDVYDSFGTLVWTRSQSASGGGPFTATYAGPALVPGMYYQLRIAAIATGGAQLSQTEDLKGVFFKP